MLPPDIERCALLGWRLYPASSRDRRACFKGATDAATCDLNVLARWAQEFPRCNWRVVMSGSGIWALDLDSTETHAHDGIAAFRDLVKLHGPIPPRPMARTGGNGLVLFFRHTSEKLIGDGGHPAPGIDPRRGRQSQTIPPSRHTATGRPYRWLTAPWDTSPPKAPEWLLGLLRPVETPKRRIPLVVTTDAARRQLYQAGYAVAHSVPGVRNDVLNRRAFQIGKLIASGLLGETEAVSVLHAAALHAGLDHIEARATIRSGLQSGR